MRDNDKYFMNLALEEAKKSCEMGEIPIGAVIVSGDNIIARCHNLTEMLCDPTAHAEMQAITTATSFLGGKYLQSCTIYVTIEPCPMCASALYWAQIGKVVYGAKDEKRGYSVISDKLMHPKTEVVSGVLENECAEIMRKFFKKLR
ncbi:MAG: nucleoside deaminase [Bacteroidetes bacterium]|nr:nucleoside deaminase [Bacteroidota bacterium]